MRINRTIQRPRHIARSVGLRLSPRTLARLRRTRARLAALIEDENRRLGLGYRPPTIDDVVSQAIANLDKSLSLRIRQRGLPLPAGDEPRGQKAVVASAPPPRIGPNVD